MFSKILIANRGEIAVRIIRACKEMGISTVAVFSEADREALHVSLADESYCIGPAPVGESYLNMAAIISAAICSGAQAIHPGYGLLSENARFAALCEECNITFIGPKSETIAKTGDKDEARKTMRAAGVPVIPGCDAVADVEEAKAQAEKIGFPLLIKARAGGGGRGIRLVKEASELEAAYQNASREALSAFGDGGVYMEKYLYPAKHIEMQILCDNFGNVVCLGERECSIQRKNQKLIEECPSSAIDQKTREKMIEVATKAAKAVNYRNAGTVEFLFDRDGNFYFMEMNTRIQVEHGVTEMVTGTDLIIEQIRVAMGEPLSFTQEEVTPRGHAIECRINAEDPSKNFRPCPGRITDMYLPGGKGVRIDSAIYSGCEVSPYYDSMITKLIVFAATRKEAIAKMHRALGEVIIEGITTNIDFLYEIMERPDYQEGDFTIQYLEKVLEERSQEIKK